MSLRRIQYSVSRGIGRYGLTGEPDVTFEPRLTIPNSPVVLLLHGLLGSCDFFQDNSWIPTHPNVLKLAPQIASYGLKVIAINGGPAGGTGANNPFTHWGNPSHTARLETVRSTLGVSQVCLIGISMGNYAALQYAVNHPSNTAAIVALSGCSDIVAFYEANGKPTHMSDPWGVASGADLPAAADIKTHANLVGKRWLAFHCQDDATVPYATATAMASHIGSTANLVSYATGDHAGTFDQCDMELIASWIWDYS